MKMILRLRSILTDIYCKRKDGCKSLRSDPGPILDLDMVFDGGSDPD